MKTRTATLTLLLTALLVGSSPAQERVGDFIVGESRDAMTDEVSQAAMTESKDGEVRLALLCQSGQQLAILTLSDPLLRMEMVTMGSDPPEVQYRFGSGEPVGPMTWRVNEDGDVLAAPDTLTFELYDQVRESWRVAVRIWNGDGDVVTTAEFTLGGSAKALSRLPCFQAGVG